MDKLPRPIGFDKNLINDVTTIDPSGIKTDIIP